MYSFYWRLGAYPGNSGVTGRGRTSRPVGWRIEPKRYGEWGMKLSS